MSIDRVWSLSNSARCSARPYLTLGLLRNNKKNIKKTIISCIVFKFPNPNLSYLINKYLSFQFHAYLKRNNWERHWAAPYELWIHANVFDTIVFFSMGTPLFNHSSTFICYLCVKYLSWKLNWKNNIIIGTNKSSVIFVFWKSKHWIFL